MHYWVRASSSDFGGTLPQPRRHSLSLSLSLYMRLHVFQASFFIGCCSWDSQWSYSGQHRQIEGGRVRWPRRQEVSQRYRGL
jgi:hypothetical protein